MNLLTKWSPFPTTRWDPFKELQEFEKRLEGVFGRWPHMANGGGAETMTVPEWSPLVDVAEDEKEYTLTAELPEMKKEDVKVTVENGVLEISGERKFEKEEKDKKYHRIERGYGSFLRTFTLPEGTKPEKLTAEYKDGVLKVHLPKDETAKPKAIEVKVS